MKSVIKIITRNLFAVGKFQGLLNVTHGVFPLYINHISVKC